jgi:hypothetical protein
MLNPESGMLNPECRMMNSGYRLLVGATTEIHRQLWRRSWVSVIRLICVICVICGLDSGARPASIAGISLDAAKSLEAKIRLLSTPAPGRPGPLQPIVVTESETNSYLKYNGPEFLPPGVHDPEIHISPERIDGAANVDFKQLNQASKTDDWGAKMLAAAFPGKQRVSASGRLDTSSGQSKVTIQNVRIGSFAIPDALVSFLLADYVQKRYRIDLSKPLPLPDHVTRIQLGPGNATFYRGPTKGR